MDCDRSYLTPPLATLWHWEPFGEVAKWDDGGVDIFAKNIGLVLPGRAYHSKFPSLTALLFILEACSDRWDRGLATARLSLLQRLARSNRVASPAKVQEIVNFLVKVNQLPRQHRTSIGWQAELIEVLIDSARRIKPARNRGDGRIADGFELVSPSLELHDQLGRGGQVDRVFPAPASDPKHTGQLVTSAYAALSLFALVNWDLKQLELRAATGLDREPDADSDSIEIPETAENDFRSWLRQLAEQDDPELANAADLALSLASVIALPRPVHDPEDLPAGGISDIANRGTPERLLITELAQDDLVLMTRIALGQALYVRREAPPAAGTQVRHVLLETGIRVWGQTRPVISAVGLACVATGEDQHVDTQVYCAEAGQVTLADLTSRSGITETLSALSLDAHPGPSMNVFGEIVRDSLTTIEPILVISDDTSRDSEWVSSLSELPSSALVVSVEPSGRFTLARWSDSGRELLQQGDLSETVKRTVRSAQVHVDPSLPRIMKLPLMPLRTTCNGSGVEHFADAPGFESLCCYSVTQDRRLLYWHGDGCGATELARELPSNTVCLWHVATQSDGIDEIWIVLGTQQSGFHLVRCPRAALHRPGIRTIALECTGTVRGFYTNRSDQLVAVEQNRLARISADTGRYLNVPKLPVGAVECRGDGNLTVGGAWVRGVADSSSFFEEIPVKVDRPQDITVVSSLSGGPFILFNDGSGAFTSTGERLSMSGGLRIPPNSYVRMVSHDQNCALLVSGIDQPALGQPIIHLQDCRLILRTNHPKRLLIRRVYNPWAQLEESASKLTTSVSVRHRFSHWGVIDGSLFLKSRKGWMQIASGGATGLVIQRSENEQPKPSPIELESYGSFGFRFSTGESTDGRRVWVDGRGMVHLAMSPSEHQLSLVLADKEVSGWFSDGDKLFGRPYFTAASSRVVIWQDAKSWLDGFCGVNT